MSKAEVRAEKLKIKGALKAANSQIADKKLRASLSGAVKKAIKQMGVK